MVTEMSIPPQSSPNGQNRLMDGVSLPAAHEASFPSDSDGGVCSRDRSSVQRHGELSRSCPAFCHYYFRQSERRLDFGTQIQANDLRFSFPVPGSELLHLASPLPYVVMVADHQRIQKKGLQQEE